MENKKENKLKKLITTIGIALPLALLLLILPRVMAGIPQSVRVLFVNETEDVFYRIGCQIAFDDSSHVYYWLDKAGKKTNEYGAFELEEQIGLDVDKEYLPDKKTPEYITLSKIRIDVDNKMDETDEEFPIDGVLKIPVKEREYCIINLKGNKTDGYSAEYIGTTKSAKTQSTSKSAVYGSTYK